MMKAAKTKAQKPPTLLPTIVVTGIPDEDISVTKDSLPITTFVAPKS